MQDVEGAPFYIRHGLLTAAFLVAMVALLVYGRTLAFPYEFDDEFYILKNSFIQDLSNLWPPSGTRWFTFLTFAINYQLTGLHESGFRLPNILIHIANGMLVYLLVSLTFKTPGLSKTMVEQKDRLSFFMGLAAAIIFTAHPVNTQAVTYISQRFTSLATLLYLTALLLYIKSRLAGTGVKAVPYILSAIVALLAQKTKEISFTLPFVIALYEFAFFPSAERTWKRKLLYLAPFLLVLLVIPLSVFGPELGITEENQAAQGNLRQDQIRDIKAVSPYVYLITQFRVILTYMRLVVLPINQNFDYDYQLSRSILEPQVIFSLLFIVIVLALVVYLFYVSLKKKNGITLLGAFGALWFFIALSVESSIIPIKDIVFEHRLYLPNIGAAIAFSSFSFYIYCRFRERRGVKSNLTVAATAFILIVTVPLAASAYSRNMVWKDKITFIEDIVRKSPNKVRQRLNLGQAYFRAGRIDEAIAELQAADRLSPRSADIHYTMGYVYQHTEDFEKAITEYKITLDIAHNNIEAYNNLGVVYGKVGRHEEAIEAFKNVLRINPYYVEAYFNLANTLNSMGRTSEAIESYRVFLDHAPDKYVSQKEFAAAEVERLSRK